MTLFPFATGSVASSCARSRSPGVILAKDAAFVALLLDRLAEDPAMVLVAPGGENVDPASSVYEERLRVAPRRCRPPLKGGEASGTTEGDHPSTDPFLSCPESEADMPCSRPMLDVAEVRATSIGRAECGADGLVVPKLEGEVETSDIGDDWSFECEKSV